MKITLFPDFPPAEQLPRMADHHLAIAGKPLTRKSWGSKTALAVPEIAFACQETLAEDSTHLTPEDTVLDKIAVVFDENGLNEIRVTDQKYGPRAKTHRNNIPVLTVTLGEETQRIAGELNSMTKDRQSFGATNLPPDRSCTFEYLFRRAHGVGSF